LSIDVLSADGQTVLVSGLQGLPSAEEDLSARIDATQHPYVRLRAALEDSTARVPPQLDPLSLTFEGTPELAIDPAGLQAIPDSIAEGAGLPVRVDVSNLGQVASDTVVVTYTVTDAANVTEVVARDTLGILAPDATATSQLTLSTVDKVGANLLQVTVESDGPPECITFNNTVLRNFFVRGDNAPPVLSVLVDGRVLPPTPPALIDPDGFGRDPDDYPYVGVSPEFEIVVADDNAFFALTDSTLVEVRLTIQDLLTTCEIPYASPDLRFEPASGPGQQARVMYTPDLSAAGRPCGDGSGAIDPNDPSSTRLYTLSIEAKDARGNEIDDPFTLVFRVQDDQEIADLYPYPNPMSEHTTFAFEVRGGTSETLRDFRLRIYTVAGRLVREFEEVELNGGQGLRVGWNTLRWDGTDADGDRVATGVYLYRFSATGEDGTFEGDIEKVAVIR
jgi:hypothetical protein